MQAHADEIAVLEQLGEIDAALIRLTKDFEALPQRAEILSRRKKIGSLEEKAKVVAASKAAAEKKLALVVDEDEMLAGKQAALQADLDSNGAFRDIAAKTKEMNGYAKRRTTLEGELEKVGAELDKVAQLEGQLDALLANERAREAKAVASFQQEGGEMRRRIVEAQQLHEALLSQVGPELADAYQKAATRCGGIALGYLRDGKCSTCRSGFEPAKLSRIKSEAPVSQCPSCRRLLIV